MNRIPTGEHRITAWCAGVTHAIILVMEDQGSEKKMKLVICHTSCACPQSPIPAKPLKWAHPPTPDETGRHNGQIKNKHTALTLKRGEGAAKGQAALTCPEIPMLTSGIGQDM